MRSLPSRRITTPSPWTVGRIATRTSIARPAVVRIPNRPSCGRRRSATSSPAITLIGDGRGGLVGRHGRVLLDDAVHTEADVVACARPGSRARRLPAPRRRRSDRVDRLTAGAFAARSPSTSSRSASSVPPRTSSSRISRTSSCAARRRPPGRPLTRSSSATPAGDGSVSATWSMSSIRSKGTAFRRSSTSRGTARTAFGLSAMCARSTYGSPCCAASVRPLDRDEAISHG